MKTLQGWHESGERIYDRYVKPGDEVDFATIEYFANCVPPHYYIRDYLQYGEAWDIAIGDDGRYHETWTTFYEEGGHWYYAGHCFSNEIKDRG